MPRIKSVSFLDDYTIVVELYSGITFVHDLKPKLLSVRFAPLQDIEFFKSGELLKETSIEWNEVVSLHVLEIV